MKQKILFILLLILFNFSLAQVPSNNEIQNAVNITSIPYVDFNVRTQNATPDSWGDIGSCPIGYLSLPRVYYRFIPQADISLRIEIANGSTSSFVMVTRSNTSMATSDYDLYLEDNAQCTNATFTEYNFSAGLVYYILVNNPTSATNIIFYEIGTDNILSFPDNNFKNALFSSSAVIQNVDMNQVRSLCHGGYGGVINYLGTTDFNNDGEIQAYEALFVNGLDLQSQNITDLTGIEYFPNLYLLNIQNNNINDLSILQNLNLKYLNCVFNPLPSTLNFSAFPQLEVLLCANQQLTNLDVSQNTQLRGLTSAAISNSILTNIDVSNNTDLECLWHGFTPMMSIDLSNNLNLKYLRLSQNNMPSINISQNILLEELEINNNLLQTLDVTNNTALSYISFRGNDVSSVDLSQNLGLEKLHCRENQLTSLDVSQNTLLEYLDCSLNQLSSLDLINNIQLEGLLCSDNQLTILDVSQNLALGAAGYGSGIDCSRNLLTSLDLSNNINLRRVIVTDNYYLESLNVKNGNNTLISTSFLNTDGCTNLETICVDEVGYAINNFTNIEPQTIFVEDCNATTINYNLIMGNVTLDNENDGCDMNDVSIQNLMIQTTDGTNTFSTFTDINGDYILDVTENTYNTSIINLPSHFSSNPSIITENFVGFNNTEVADFCVVPNQTTINDLNIILLPIEEARPGFDSDYQLIYQNMSILPISGTLSLQFDDTMQSFLSASPSQNSIIANTITFDYSNLLPFESRSIQIIMNTNPPPIVNGGDLLNFTAQILPVTNDVNANDNTYDLTQIVVNSFDPNDKQVLQGSQITIDETDEYLDYLIRFQNTGTASAINVVVTDELNDKLDWITFQPISSSHIYNVQITNGNFVEFIFDNINLPDSTNDEPNSHGYVAFKIKPKNDVIVGDIINGEAKIYFDYNLPIITNSISTEIVAPLSVGEFNENQLSIYPNPTKNTVIIKANQNIEMVTVYDINGRLLKTNNPTYRQSEIEVKLGELSNGIYFLKIQTSLGIQTQKIIKK